MASSLCSCSSQQKESPMKAKVEEYASVELKSDLVNNLSEQGKRVGENIFPGGENYRRPFLEADISVIKQARIPLPTAMRKSLP